MKCRKKGKTSKKVRVLQQHKVSNTEIYHYSTDKKGYKSKATQQVRPAYKKD